jgi:hypothetical protein
MRHMENENWKHARRSAFVQDVLAAFTHRPADLLPFEEVRHKLHLSNMQYLGLQEVPVDNIVGSVGRYQDFTRAFFPRRDNLSQRWRRVDQLVTSGGGMPPIELYQVGEAYFVRDGNHRVSVARQHHMPLIEAYVWQYTTHIPLEPDSDVDAVLCQAAHTAFVEHTGVDRLCPDLPIEITQPGGYEELLHEIDAYQRILSEIDQQEMPYDESVALWCEMRYAPIVEIIRRGDILREFPGRTETDLYLWLVRNQAELGSSHRGSASMEDAADDLGKHSAKRLRPAHHIRKGVRWMAYTLAVRADSWRRASRRGRQRKEG